MLLQLSDEITTCKKFLMLNKINKKKLKNEKRRRVDNKH